MKKWIGLFLVVVSVVYCRVEVPYGDGVLVQAPRLAESHPLLELVAQFEAAGGKIFPIDEQSAPFVLRQGDEIFPICSGGWCRSQTLMCVLQDCFSGAITVHRPHAARYGWDPFDGTLYRKHNLPLEIGIDEFYRAFHRHKSLRAGFKHNDKWMSYLEDESKWQELYDFYTAWYWGYTSDYRLVYATFAGNCHVTLKRLLDSGKSLENVVILAFDMEDYVSHPREEGVIPRSCKAYRNFYDVLRQLLRYEG